METEKGRWFLAEYARRNRSANTDQVLGAIGRLETLLKRERRPDADRIRLDIGEMKDAIERTKLEIAQIKSDGNSHLSRFERASSELDAIVEQTEAATSEILGAAEKIQEYAWTMREAGVDEALCDDVENLTTTIYMACSFQDLTGQRTQKVVHVLRYLENRINAMIEIWGMEDEEVSKSPAPVATGSNPHDTRPDAHLLNGPALAGEGIEQNRIDDLLGEDEAADAAALQAVANDAIDAMDFDRIDAMADIDNPVTADMLFPTHAPVELVEPVHDVEFAEVDPDDAAVAVSGDVALDQSAIDEIHFDAIDEETAVEDVTDLEAPADAATEPAISDADLAAAVTAMDDAIETLKGVTEATRSKKDAIVDDPFEKMTKTERQALFS
ncbi:protein phosphatase CheZ [Oryzibacter oryziterrae]|uniref:protein phosphatase CheZ n=1 Tax=Oryzibacter oryziterrae TaxID=2766474 RepID=UPI001F40779F|nr:protein phosphatase CheZ [Oryzibacter oryziterrae]